MCLIFLTFRQVYLAEFEDDDWYSNVSAFKKQIARYKKDLDASLAKYFKTRKNEQKTKSKPKWYGLTPAQHKQYFKLSNVNSNVTITQSDLAYPIRQWSREFLYTKFTKIDFKKMGNVGEIDTKYLMFTDDSKDRKFNKLFYLTNAIDNNILNENFNQVSYVSIGGVDKNEQCVRALNYFFRSTIMSIERQPYVPDLQLQIDELHGSFIKPDYRVLMYGFAGYLKLNVRINSSDIENRNKLMKDDKTRWHDKKNHTKELLQQIFYDDNHGAARKLVNLNDSCMKTILQYLRKENDLNDTNCWFIRVMEQLAASYQYGWDEMLKYFNVWRYCYSQRDPDDVLDSDNNKWLFNLIDYIKPNECICTIKSIGCAVTRIISYIRCLDNWRTDEDGLFFIKCIILILDLQSKGDIYGCSNRFTSSFYDNIEFIEDRNAQKAFETLKNVTTSIGEIIRVIGNLSAFDFELLIQDKYVHQCWLTYLYAAFVGLADYIQQFESVLPQVFKYLNHLDEQDSLGMLIYSIFVCVSNIHSLLLCFMLSHSQ